MRSLAPLAALAALVPGCFAPGVSSAPADAPDELAALGPHVVVLAAPLRDETSIVGGLVDPTTNVPDTTRRLVVPATASSLGYLTYDGVREIGASGGVALGPFDADLAAEAVTHVSYHVSVSETVFLAGEQLYDARSACCDARGELDPSCEGGYVVRAWIGSGEFRYLARTETGGGFSGGFVESHGGVVFSIARARSFTHAVFAIDVAPAAPVCAHAYCDEPDGAGRCARCRTLAMAAPLGEVSAPADDVLELDCAGMPPSAPARATVRGEVHVTCSGTASAVLSLTGAGAEPQVLELVPAPMGSPLSFVRTLEGLSTTSRGVLGASLDLVSCACGSASTRCELDPELELAVELDPL